MTDILYAVGFLGVTGLVFQLGRIYEKMGSTKVKPGTIKVPAYTQPYRDERDVSHRRPTEGPLAIAHMVAEYKKGNPVQRPGR